GGRGDADEWPARPGDGKGSGEERQGGNHEPRAGRRPAVRIDRSMQEDERGHEHERGPGVPPQISTPDDDHDRRQQRYEDERRDEQETAVAEQRSHDDVEVDMAYTADPAAVLGLDRIPVRLGERASRRA